MTPGVSMKLTSVFEPDGRIPPRYTCDGKDESPPLSWSDVPENVESSAEATLVGRFARARAMPRARTRRATAEDSP
jgi:hypothetical protein